MKIRVEQKQNHKTYNEVAYGNIFATLDGEMYVKSTNLAISLRTGSPIRFDGNRKVRVANEVVVRFE